MTPKQPFRAKKHSTKSTSIPSAPCAVNHPKHYTSHPSGVECIQITEHMNFNLGNAVKYIWRASLKGKEIQDLEKALWYIEREIQRLQRGPNITFDPHREFINDGAMK